MKIRIRLQDKVRVIAGKDKGKDGKIIQVLPEDNMVVVEGANRMYKHIRSRKKGEKGQRIEFAAPLALGKVMLICPKCSKPTRIGISTEGSKRARSCKKCKASID